MKYHVCSFSAVVQQYYDGPCKLVIVYQCSCGAQSTTIAYSHAFQFDYQTGYTTCSKCGVLA